MSGLGELGYVSDFALKRSEGKIELSFIWSVEVSRQRYVKAFNTLYLDLNKHKDVYDLKLSVQPHTDLIRLKRVPKDFWRVAIQVADSMRKLIMRWASK